MSGEIFAALAAIQGSVGAVGKTRKNAQQGYSFRGIDDVMAHVQEVQSAHGVVCVPRVVEREREVVTTKSGGTMASVRLVVDHHFYAKDGSSVVCTTVGEAMDSGDKASNKAMSAALKYALTETYMIPTYEADRDTEDASPERGPSRPAGNHTPPQASPPGSQSDRQRLSHAVECVRTVAELTALVPAMSALNLSKSDPLRLRWGARRDELSKEVAT